MCKCEVTDEQIKTAIDTMFVSKSIVNLGDAIASISKQLNIANDNKLYRRVVEYIRGNNSLKTVYPKGYNGSGIYTDFRFTKD